jgi:hypothetical protein
MAVRPLSAWVSMGRLTGGPWDRVTRIETARCSRAPLVLAIEGTRGARAWLRGSARPYSTESAAAIVVTAVRIVKPATVVAARPTQNASESSGTMPSAAETTASYGNFPASRFNFARPATQSHS